MMRMSWAIPAKPSTIAGIGRCWIMSAAFAQLHGKHALMDNLAEAVDDSRAVEIDPGRRLMCERVEDGAALEGLVSQSQCVAADGLASFGFVRFSPFGFALVMQLFAAGQRQLALDPAFLQIDFRRNQRESSFARFAEEFFDRLKVARVQLDRSPNLGLWYGLRCLPTMLCFVDGEECIGIFGTTSKEAILSQLKLVIKTDGAETNLFLFDLKDRKDGSKP